MSVRTTRKNVLTVDVQSPAGSNASKESNLDRKFDELSERLMSKLIAVENHMMEQFGSLRAEFTNLRADFKTASIRIQAVENRVELVEKDISKIVKRLEVLESKEPPSAELCEKIVSLSNRSLSYDALRAKINVLENDVIVSDCVLYNVPNEANVESVISALLKTIDCNSVKPVKVFRVRSQPNKCSPIIIKLHSGFERSQFFKAIALWRKNSQSPLRLSDVGLVGSGTLSIFECLTTTNREIMRSAIKFKLEKRLTAVFSLRGDVFVRATQTSNAVKIKCLSELGEVAGVGATV